MKRIKQKHVKVGTRLLCTKTVRKAHYDPKIGVFDLLKKDKIYTIQKRHGSEFYFKEKETHGWGYHNLDNFEALNGL